MRHRRDYAEWFWLRVDDELWIWQQRSEEYERAGMAIPGWIEHNIHGMEDAWRFMEEFWEWSCEELQEVNGRIRSYISLARQMTEFYGVDMVRVS